MATPDANEINVERSKTGANVVTSRKANPWLIALGAILVLIFVGGVVYARAEGSETVETSPPAASGGNGAGAAGSSGQAQASSKTTTTKNVPSESLLTAVLATGAALVVVGVLYGRISTIKLPGGAEIGLSPDEKKKTVEKAVEAHPHDPHKAAEVAQVAEDKLLAKKAHATVELPDAMIDNVVSDVVEEVV